MLMISVVTVMLVGSNSYGGGADLWANAVPSPGYQARASINNLNNNSNNKKKDDDGNSNSNLSNHNDNNNNKNVTSTTTSTTVPSKCDGRLEVLGVRMIHLATSQVQTGLPSSIKLAQASKIEVRLLGGAGRAKMPMQIDGEPQLVQQPCVIRITPAPEGV